MYTLVNTTKFSIKEFLNWNELLTTIESEYYLTNNINSHTGKNYIEIYNESNSLYIIGLSHLEIDYIQLKFTKK